MLDHTKTITVILAAGQARRMNAGINKMFLPLADQPLLLFSVDFFNNHSAIDEIVVIAAPGEENICKQLLADKYKKLSTIVTGGATRHQSEYAAMNALRPQLVSNPAWIIFHDGARPLIPTHTFSALLEKARHRRAAVPGLPLNENLLLTTEDPLLKSDNKTSFWKTQTPQIFVSSILLSAYDQAAKEGFEGSDTAACITNAGHPVFIVPGHPYNIKVTTSLDMLRATIYLQQMQNAEEFS